MSGGLGIPSIDFGGLERLGTTLGSLGQREETARLLGQQLDAALGAQGGGHTPLGALGTAPAPTVPRMPAFTATSGDMGSYLAQTRARESGGNDLATNPNSTAKGRYQFTDDTWKAVARKHPDLGLTPGGWRDPAQQERAMQAFTADNAKALTSAGIPVNPTNLYGAHFLGAGGAAQFIPNAINSPDAPAVQFVSPGAARANRTVFYNRDGSPKSAGEVYAWLGGSRGQQGAPAPARPAPVQVASAEADMPAEGALPAGFQIPAGGSGDFVPGTVASPAVAQDRGASAPGGIPAAAAQRLNPAQVANLRAMLQNPQLQGHAAKIIEGLNRPDEFSFQVVGDQLVRTSKSGRAEVVPNIVKPATYQTQKGADGNDYTFNPQTGEWRRAIEGKSTQFTDLVSPEDRAAAGIQPSYTGPAQRGPDGEIRLPGKASTEINLNNAAEKAQDVEIGKQYGATFNDLQSGGRAASGQINTFRLMEKLIESPNFYSGSGSTAFLAAKRAAAALGVPGAAEAAAPNELFAKLANQSVLDKLGGSLGSGVSNADVTFISQTTANAQNTPEGNRQIIRFGRALAERQIQVARLARDYAKAHSGRLDAGFDDELSRWAQANPLFPEAAAQQAPIAPGPESAQPTVSQQRPAASAPSPRRPAPAVGTVSKGYRFIGGDPANPASWERAAPAQEGPVT